MLSKVGNAWKMPWVLEVSTVTVISDFKFLLYVRNFKNEKITIVAAPVSDYPITDSGL